jgi:hypothetical protein
MLLNGTKKIYYSPSYPSLHEERDDCDVVAIRVSHFKISAGIPDDSRKYYFSELQTF